MLPVDRADIDAFKCCGLPFAIVVLSQINAAQEVAFRTGEAACCGGLTDP